MLTGASTAGIGRFSPVSVLQMAAPSAEGSPKPAFRQAGEHDGWGGGEVEEGIVDHGTSPVPVRMSDGFARVAAGLYRFGGCSRPCFAWGGPQLATGREWSPRRNVSPVRADHGRRGNHRCLDTFGEADKMEKARVVDAFARKCGISAVSRLIVTR